MEVGADALLIGVGPGAACTSREVLGLGVPQVTATADAPRRRDFHYKKTGRYIPIVTDGGMTDGRRRVQGLASGADAVNDRLGLRARDRGAGRGYHWGMADAARNLPRATRIRVGIAGSLEQILFGPGLHGRRHAQPRRASAPAWARGGAVDPRAAADGADHRAHHQDRGKSSSRRRSWGVHARVRAAGTRSSSQRVWAVLPPHPPPHRELGVHAVVADVNRPAADLRGAAASSSRRTGERHRADSPSVDRAIYELGCRSSASAYGHQLLARDLSGRVEPGTTKEYGHSSLHAGEGRLFAACRRASSPSG